MAFQTVFKRYELKYMLTLEQKEKILEAMSLYMELDKYGRTTIRNIYFDTDNYRLIRRSIEKPAYKEKLRIRSYSQATADSTVFVELKKKYEKVVYKRRLPLFEADAMAWICRENPCPVNTQISREIDYFIDFYGKLKPTVFLSYEREAYYDKGGGDFRVTFDDNISSVPVTNALLEGQAQSQSNQQSQMEQNFGRPGDFGGGFPGGNMPSDMPSDIPDMGGGKNPFGDMFGGAADYITEVDSAMNLTVVFQMIGVGLLLTLIASAASVLFIMRYDPLKILANRD